MLDNKEDQYAVSLRSLSSVLVITPKTSVLSDHSTDEFELIDDSDAEIEAASTNGGNGSIGASNARERQEDYDDDSSSVSSASVSPSIYAHEYEHCRRYHSYKSGRYPFPNDLPEQRREETLHLMMLEVTVS